MRLIAPEPTELPAIAWEECACLLCGGCRHAPLLEAADPLTGACFLIVRCASCGLSFTNPRPNLDSIDRFYPADYPCHQAKERKDRGRVLCGLLPRHGHARLLDFGCGGGDFLARMQALGWTVTGLDRCEAAVARVRARGLTAYVGTLPHPLWQGESFEAITMWQALEHVHQPLEALRAAHRLLTPGGRLVVAVPNLESWGARWFGPDWFGLDLPRHLTHFTPITLRAMLAHAGFHAVELRQERRSGWIRHSAQRSPARDAPTRLLRTRVVSSIASWWGRWTGRAECLIALATKC